MINWRQKAETAYIKHLITTVYPEGIVSIVSDTFDFWSVLTYSLPLLSKEINERQGKVIIRPDSGNPVDIICGHRGEEDGTPASIGALQMLWDTFGGRINDAGYKELNPKIGLIYGDAITVDRAKVILELMERKGFASTNIVFGVGSFTYQYVTRDTFGFAMKATSAVVNGERRAIFKDPVTDSAKSSKKSAKGLLMVEVDNGEFYLEQDVSEEWEKKGLLETVFENGKLMKTTNLKQIRDNLKVELDVL